MTDKMQGKKKKIAEMLKLSNLSALLMYMRQKWTLFRQFLMTTDWKKARKRFFARIKKINIKKTRTYKTSKKFIKKLSDSWKMLLICVPTFLFCYYFLGSRIAENIDVTTEYQLRQQNIPMLETATGMAFLLRREVDDKMWTPNLPPVFPAYVLDNMPNFQTGIVHAVRDIVAVLVHFTQNTELQKQEIKQADKLLNYPATIWLMHKKDGFKLAPSSNSQYRKAAAQLEKFGKDGVYYPEPADLAALLQKIGKSLQKLATKNENFQNEHASDLTDTKSDDLFYYNRGYAFAMWQITKVMGKDYRKTILEYDVYTEWTYLVNSLKKAAELKPVIVRNGQTKDLFTPNHLLEQNYYMLRALTAIERIRAELKREQCK